MIFLSLLVAGVLFLLWQAESEVASPIKHNNTEEPNVFFCSAENVIDNTFMEGDINFGASDARSGKKAKTGRYSCKLPKGKEGYYYGFSFTEAYPIPGERYHATVWRAINTKQSGFLAVSIDGEPQTYIQENISVEKDNKGWEKLEIRFTVPYHRQVNKLKIYVYSMGEEEVFFDDLSITRIPYDTKSDFTPTLINIVIDKRGMDKLIKKRDQAVYAGILETSENDWVDAQLTEAGQPTLKVKLRLKGDWLDHLTGEKWSFRIKVGDAMTWRQMSTFSMQSPMARYFLNEWLVHRLWKNEDVLATRYDFIELQLNGKPMGIYAYEEHFDKLLAEANQRREGPIVKFSETAYWSTIKSQLASQGFVAAADNISSMQWQKADTEAFQMRKIIQDTSLQRQYQQAVSMLYQYQQGLAEADQIFDLKKLASYYAICDVLNAYHSIASHNLRFYYNPITALLEPIGFDGYGGPPEEQFNIIGAGALHPSLQREEHFFTGLFMDPNFAALYTSELERISHPNYFSSFLENVYLEWGDRLLFLQKEFEDYQPYFKNYKTEANFIRSILFPVKDFSLVAYQDTISNETQQLMLENRHTLPLEIIGFSTGQGQQYQPLSSTFILPGAIQRSVLSRLRKEGQAHFGQIRFLEQEAMKQQMPPVFFEFSVNNKARYLFYKTLGTDSIFVSEIRKNAIPQLILPSQILKNSAALSPGPYYNIKGKEIVFHKAQHHIRKDIVIPKGYTVIIPAGTELLIEDGRRFLSYSPVKALGTGDEPIAIKGQAKGFTILQAEGLSELSFVYFDGLNTLEAGNWQLTGGATFYESDVHLYRCNFVNSSCEDALNIIRSSFHIKDCQIIDAESDGLDLDFCKGTIENSVFANTQNDGIDCSGSIVNIRNCVLRNNGDKGLSVGEESDVTIFNSHINGSNIALASKDHSVLYVKEVTLENCIQGFVAFQKKAEFGGGKILAESYEANAVKRLFSVGKGSSLQIDGQYIESTY